MSAWYYRVGKERVGPYTTKQMEALIERKKISAKTLIQREGERNWVEAPSVFAFTEEDAESGIIGFSADSQKTGNSADVENEEAGEARLVEEDAEPEESENHPPLREVEWETSDSSKNAPIGCLGFLLIGAVSLLIAGIEMSRPGWPPIFSAIMGLGGFAGLVFALSTGKKRLAIEKPSSTDGEPANWLFVDEMRMLGFPLRRSTYQIHPGCHLRIKQSASTSGVLQYSVDLVSAKRKKIVNIRTVGSPKHAQQIAKSFAENLDLPFTDRSEGLQDVPVVASIGVDNFHLEIRKTKDRLAVVVNTNEGNKNNPNNLRFAWLHHYVKFSGSVAKVIYKIPPPNVHIPPRIVFGPHPKKGSEPFTIFFADDASLKKAVQFLERETGRRFEWDDTSASW